MDNSENTKKVWKKLKKGDIIGIQDQQELQDQLEEGGIPEETNYTVSRIKTVIVGDDMAEILLIELEQGDKELLLSVKIVDDSITQRLWFKVDEFEQGNREDVLENGNEFIFEAPEDEDDFFMKDLEYAEYIEKEIDDEPVVFEKFPQGEVHGECTTVPRESGIDKTFMTIVEYYTDSDLDNPYILITEEEDVSEENEEEEEYDDGYDGEYFDSPDYEEEEENDEDEEDNPGGYITVYLGSDLTPPDINIYK
jgi:hypothetical protein